MSAETPEPGEQESAIGAPGTIVTEKIIITRGFGSDGEKMISVEVDGDDFIIHYGMLKAAETWITEAASRCACGNCDDDDEA